MIATDDGQPDRIDGDSPQGRFDWTTSSVKWGAVGLLTLFGFLGLSWSVIRGEGWNARNAPRPVQAEVEARDTAAFASDTQRSPEGWTGRGIFSGAARNPDARPADSGIPEQPGVSPAPAHLAHNSDAGVGEPLASSAPPRTPISTPEPFAGPGTSRRININAATEEELQLLPGIGPARARAIIEDRRENGVFRSIDELDRVDGIGPVTVEGLRRFARTS